jgi:hypothetical protein
MEHTLPQHPYSQDALARNLIARLKQLGIACVHELRGISEEVVFSLPAVLDSDATTRCPSVQPMKTIVSLGPTSPWNMARNGEK